MINHFSTKEDNAMAGLNVSENIICTKFIINSNLVNNGNVQVERTN